MCIKGGSGGGFDPRTKGVKGQSTNNNTTQDTTSTDNTQASTEKSEDISKAGSLKGKLLQLSQEQKSELNDAIEAYLKKQQELSEEAAKKYVEHLKYFYSLDFVIKVANSMAPEDEAWAEYFKFIDKVYNDPAKLEELEKIINGLK